MKKKSYTFTLTLGSVTVLAMAVVISAVQSRGSTAAPFPWPAAGNDLSNSRNQPLETKIGVSNVSSLAPKWTFQTGGDVSATPTVGATAIYFPDWAGNLYAVNKDTGQAIWSAQISKYDGVPKAISRVSPALSPTDLIIGDIESSGPHDGARIMANFHRS